MLQDGAIDLGDGTKKAKEEFKDLLQKIAYGEIIADAKIVHNAKAFLDEYQKEVDYRQDISLFAASKLKIKDLLKKIIPGMKPSKELFKAAFASIEANRSHKILERLKTDHKNVITTAEKEKPNIGVSKEQEKGEGIFSRLVGYGNNLSNKILGSNLVKEETAEKLAHSLGMFANIGAHLGTFTVMEKDLTLSIIPPLLYYGTTSTALSLAGIGGSIAAATYGIYRGAKWLAGSSAFEQKGNTI